MAEHRSFLKNNQNMYKPMHSDQNGMKSQKRNKKFFVFTV